MSRSRWRSRGASARPAGVSYGTSTLDADYIQLDEMQTFEHAAAKALTIAVAIRWKTGKLLAARVGRIPANGHLAELGKTKYGWTTNESAAACKAALTLAGQAAKPEVTVACDRATTYPGLVASAFPAGVSVVPYKSRSFGGSADFDPLLIAGPLGHLHRGQQRLQLYLRSLKPFAGGAIRQLLAYQS